MERDAASEVAYSEISGRLHFRKQKRYPAFHETMTLTFLLTWFMQSLKKDANFCFFRDWLR